MLFISWLHCMTWYCGSSVQTHGNLFPFWGSHNILSTFIENERSCILWLVFRALFIGWEKGNFCIFASSLLGATIWDSGIREKCNDSGLFLRWKQDFDHVSHALTLGSANNGTWTWHCIPLVKHLHQILFGVKFHISGDIGSCWD